MTAHTPQPSPGPNPSPAFLELQRIGDGLFLHQSVYAAAKLGIADLLASGATNVADLASRVSVNEDALYRVLRMLSSKGIFEETAPRVFQNTESSNFLRADVPGSLRPAFIFRGSQFIYPSFGEILHSIKTGEPASMKAHGGVDDFEYLRRNPEEGRIFDDAMTAMSSVIGPAVAAAYDFGQWESITDVGGGNGILLASILKAHPKLRGVLADLQHVLERARQRGYLAGELQSRAKMLECDFFREVPAGTRAYVMKSVIHDWNDEKARQILMNCRRAVPGDGALLLVEWVLSGPNEPSHGKLVDVTMLVMTGGKERTPDEYGQLLSSAGFRLNRVVPTPAGVAVFEALPA